MARKTIGYVKLEWICPRCGSKNPGPQKTCSTCGGPQPQETAFTQGAGQPIIQGQEAEPIARAGADVHCPFCGARNPGDTKICSQCGGDLIGAVKRSTGQVLGAYSATPGPEVTCPNCGQPNPAAALNCLKCGASLALLKEPVPPPAAAAPRKISPVLMVAGILLIAAVIIGILALSGMLGKTEKMVAAVQQVGWSTSVVIEEYQPVQKSDWKDQIPADVEVGACDYRYSYTDSQPQPVSTEVCSLPYTVDKGTGYGEVVQDCTYEVYEEYCSYTSYEWVAVEQSILEGSNMSPQMSQPVLDSDQRLGQSSQEFSIVFVSDQGAYTYKTSDENLFRQAAVGSSWNLTISGDGRLIDVEPIN